MTTMADSLVNSAMRPLKLRRRPDLESRKHHYDGRSYWVVKEPLGLNYFRFHEEEFAILNMLDGQTSLQAIKDRFQAEFAPQRISDSLCYLRVASDPDQPRITRKPIRVQ